MIIVTRLSAAPDAACGDITVNADLIEMIEATPDTLLTLTTGRRILVRESAPEIVARVLRYRRAAFGLLPAAAAAEDTFPDAARPT